MFKKFSRILGVIVLLLTFCFSVSSRTDDHRRSFYTEGLYLGAQVNYMSVSGGDFDGSTLIDLWRETISIPKLDPGIGFGGLIGFRDGNYGLEFSFVTSSLTGTILDETDDTTLTTFSFYIKYWLTGALAFQPYLLLGVDMNLLSATDAAVLTEYPYTVGDIDLSGVNFDLGAGISYYITPKIAINAGANIHFLVLKNISSELNDVHNTDYWVTGSLLNIYGELTFCLK